MLLPVTLLRGGHTTSDPRLDRLRQFDERSRAFPVRPLLATAHEPRSYTWRCDRWLDQGSEGACVGFAWSHDLAARPAARYTDDERARALYQRAQQIDEWAGEEYAGTSVLAGAKAAVEAGHLTEYRWAFAFDDLVLTLGYRGPVVLGVPWTTGMFNTDSAGFVHATGRVAGGHAVLARGVNVRHRYVLLRNSWGMRWGTNGDARIGFGDLAALLADGGEACVPVKRLR